MRIFTPIAVSVAILLMQTKNKVRYWKIKFFPTKPPRFSALKGEAWENDVCAGVPSSSYGYR
ncbi:MAG TPA: hypothetical protein VIC84_04195 [Blastocatellia bacterium]|jgi:hypothetical protein